MSKLISHSRSRWYKSYRVTIKRSAAVLCRIFLCRDLQNNVLCAGKEKSMNVRNPVDYSAMYTGLDRALERSLPQMELYLEIGKLVSARTEKGAAVAAAEYLAAKYPDNSGFSPRNLRRMRDFFRTYKAVPDILNEALLIGWTQNVVIMEADLSMDQRHWYLRAALQFGWSKVELLRQISDSAHEKTSLDYLPSTSFPLFTQGSSKVILNLNPHCIPRLSIKWECSYSRSGLPWLRHRNNLCWQLLKKLATCCHSYHSSHRFEVVKTLPPHAFFHIIVLYFKFGLFLYHANSLCVGGEKLHPI